MMLRAAIVVLVLVSTSGVASAQWGWDPWDDNDLEYEDDDWRDRPRRRAPYYRPPPPRDGFFYPWEWEEPRRRRRESSGPRSRSGGARPHIEARPPTSIFFPSKYAVGSIIIDQSGRQLILVQSSTEALHYPISVGREGFTWTGTEKISRVVDWPDWYPPADMRERDPSLPKHMSGGLRNPLGAKALYLGKTLYRIHGTNDRKSIGRAASSGCFRMHNGHVIDLAGRVQIGTVVTVVNRLPRDLERIVGDQVQPARVGSRAGKSS